MPRSILVVCGLNREATLAAGEGIVTVAGGGHRPTLETRLAAIDPATIKAVVSFGLAGALVPTLTVGDLAVPSSCLDETGPVPLTLRWPDAIASASARTGLTLLGVDAPAMTASAKADIARRTGAHLVDMESHVAGRWADRHGLPFGILRAISDGCERDLPPLVGSAMRPDGSVDVLAVMAGLARDPAQIAGLLRTARDAGRAVKALRGVRRLAGGGLGLLGLDL